MMDLVELLSLYLNTDIQPNSLTELLKLARAKRRPLVARMPQRRRPQRRLDASETAALIAAHREGAGVKALATQFAMHRQTVAAVLRRHGIAPRPRGLTEDEASSAISLYREGWSLARLGNKFSVDPMTVRRVLLVAGMTLRSPHERPA